MEKERNAQVAGFKLLRPAADQKRFAVGGEVCLSPGDLPVCLSNAILWLGELAYIEPAIPVPHKCFDENDR